MFQEIIIDEFNHRLSLFLFAHTNLQKLVIREKIFMIYFI